MTAAEKASRLSRTLAQYVVTSVHRKVRQHSDHLIGEFLVLATGDQCLLSLGDESFAHSGNELPACSRCSREESLAC